MSGRPRLQGPGGPMRGEARGERATSRIVREDARVGARSTVCRAERESERWGSRRGQSRGDEDAEDGPHRRGWSASALLGFLTCAAPTCVQNGGHSLGPCRFPCTDVNTGDGQGMHRRRQKDSALRPERKHHDGRWMACIGLSRNAKTPPPHRIRPPRYRARELQSTESRTVIGELDESCWGNCGVR